MPKAAQATISAPWKQKFYAVKAGREPGVYDTWSEAEDQVSRAGQPPISTEFCSKVDGFRGAYYQTFQTRQEAEVR